ncbi:hypothetical protein [Candidatus Phytoplasma pini]|uniref:hypothetical protein n=1 Tax=Candidatus Phytoplasma pini TaxID=267362 RepID=UPI0011A8D237|nr:hypothetical protein [Candidatus Phytoplasma pini]
MIKFNNYIVSIKKVFFHFCILFFIYFFLIKKNFFLSLEYDEKFNEKIIVNKKEDNEDQNINLNNNYTEKSKKTLISKEKINLESQKKNFSTKFNSIKKQSKPKYIFLKRDLNTLNEQIYILNILNKFNNRNFDSISTDNQIIDSLNETIINLLINKFDFIFNDLNLNFFKQNLSKFKIYQEHNYKGDLVHFILFYFEEESEKDIKSEFPISSTTALLRVEIKPEEQKISKKIYGQNSTLISIIDYDYFLGHKIQEKIFYDANNFATIFANDTSLNLSTFYKL